MQGFEQAGIFIIELKAGVSGEGELVVRVYISYRSQNAGLLSACILNVIGQAKKTSNINSGQIRRT